MLGMILGFTYLINLLKITVSLESVRVDDTARLIERIHEPDKSLHSIPFKGYFVVVLYSKNNTH